MDDENIGKFSERFSRFKKGYDEYVKGFKKKNNLYDKFASSYVEFKQIQSSSHLIKLNIGGYKHTTTKATLLSKGSKFFEELLLTSSTNEEIFIDRPGVNFQYTYFIILKRRKS